MAHNLWRYLNIILKYGRYYPYHSIPDVFNSSLRFSVSFVVNGSNRAGIVCTWPVLEHALFTSFWLLSWQTLWSSTCSLPSCSSSLMPRVWNPTMKKKQRKRKNESWKISSMVSKENSQKPKNDSNQSRERNQAQIQIIKMEFLRKM